MTEYLVIKRYFGDQKNISPQNNTNEVVGIFSSSIAARICMENIIYDAIIKRNGEDTNISFHKPSYKYSFLYDLQKEHRSDSALWSGVPVGHYFATRHSNEIDKIIVHEKYEISGYIYSSWDTKKIFSVEICKHRSAIDNDLIDEDYYQTLKELAKLAKLKIDDLMDTLRDETFDRVMEDLRTNVQPVDP